MRIMVLVCALNILCGAATAAQSSRDDWKPGHILNINIDANLIYSLADAPLTSKERDQVYQLIDDRAHVSFTDQQRAEEQETVMSSRVGWIELAEDGSRQILVRGPAQLFCGTGGCRYWIFVQRHAQLQLVLEAFGNVLVRKTSSHGFLDVVMDHRVGMPENKYAVYSWNGAKYERVDSYCANWDPNNPSKLPVITSCTPDTL